MDAFPTGVVTFLFTDVQGSTRLLERLGRDYAAVRDGHDAILRAAIGDDGGRVVDTAGDGFFAVFASPRGAVSAAVRAQRDLAAAGWPDGEVVAVRMGLHTGEGVVDGRGYVGLDVHRAARIAAAAHGGQILVSEATRVLAADTLPPGVSMLDLGVHRLRDLARPERLFQVAASGLVRDFPRPRTAGARPGNLPARLADFVGRGREVAQVRELLGQHRLVTLTGPGGTGKTRLAVQVAAESGPGFPDGAFFVDLSAVRDPDLVPAAAAAALDLADEPERPVAEVVTAHVRDRGLLLVLDNFEQVTAAAAFVERLLAAAPDVRVLTTSRVPLHLYGEQEFAVAPMELPDPRQPPDPEVLRRCEAVALFVQRASAAEAGFRLTEDNAGAVAGITARLDGLPLAIELAAGRVRLLPPQQMLLRLERRLPLPAARERDVPERHRTLHATIDWSYDLLPEPERRLFRRLAVFAGGADLDAVAAVANPGDELGDTLDLLTTLVDVNLVRLPHGDAGDARVAMLETIREYGLGRLAADGEASAVRHRHAEHWLRTAQQAAGAPPGPDRDAAIRRLDHDEDNLRAALDWTAEEQQLLGLRLAVALEDHWRLSSHVREGVRRLTEFLALEPVAAPTLLRARALSVLSGLHGWIDDPDRMEATAAEALAIFRDLGDAAGLAVAVETVGWAELQMGRLEPARRNLTEAIDRYLALGDRHRAAAAMPALGIIAEAEGDPALARRRLEAAADALRELDDLFTLAMTEVMIGGVDKRQGGLTAAAKRFTSGLSTFERIDNAMGISWVLWAFADLALEHGDPARALRLVGASDRLRAGTELPALVLAHTGDVGRLARERLDPGTAAEAHRQGWAMSTEEATACARAPYDVDAPPAAR
jgi:predicted ATPase/class 3 adenylate cyclase